MTFIGYECCCIGVIGIGIVLIGGGGGKLSPGVAGGGIGGYWDCRFPIVLPSHPALGTRCNDWIYGC
jgi:hypothetical protein